MSHDGVDPQSRVIDPRKPPVVVLIGPTAVGKTAASLAIAEALRGEVVSADSRQVYRGMDIGTAKATPAEQLRVPHYLLDILDPDETMNLATFQSLAGAAIANIRQRNRLPLLVGGTGQYVKALVEGWDVPPIEPNPELRDRLITDASRLGAMALHARLTEIDPQAAATIDPRNIRRVVRALEVSLSSGQPFSQLRRKRTPAYPILQIGLTLPRPNLYERVDRRVDAMIASGLVDEVRGLLDRGYGLDLPSMSSLGYAEIGQYLLGRISLEEAIRLLKYNTRRFIRHQGAWFRTSDPAITWFDRSWQDVGEIVAFIRRSTSS